MKANSAYLAQIGPRLADLLSNVAYETEVVELNKAYSQERDQFLRSTRRCLCLSTRRRYASGFRQLYERWLEDHCGARYDH